MENCKYESDMKRLLKIIDGNGKDGLVLTVNKTEMTANEAKELAMANATAISGVNKFIESYETKEDMIAERQKERRQNRHWQVGTVITLLGVLIGMAAFMMSVLEKIS
jgi:inorganic pyrophosphatase